MTAAIYKAKRTVRAREATACQPLLMRLKCKSKPIRACARRKKKAIRAKFEIQEFSDLYVKRLKHRLPMREPFKTYCWSLYLHDVTETGINVTLTAINVPRIRINVYRKGAKRSKMRMQCRRIATV